MILKEKFEIARQLWRKNVAEERAEQTRRQQMHVYRTTEGTAFEVACALIIAATWAIEMVQAVREPVIDATNLLTGVFLSGVVALVLYSAYHPQWVHVGDTKIENARQLALLVRSARVAALTLALTIFGTSLCHLVGCQLPDWSKWIWTAIFIAIGIYYSIRISASKS